MASDQQNAPKARHPELGLDEARKAFEQARATADIYPKTIVNDRTALRRFGDWCHNVRSDPLWDLANLTEDDYAQFAEWVAQTDANTIDTLSYVGEFLIWLSEQGYIDHDLCDRSFVDS